MTFRRGLFSYLTAHIVPVMEFLFSAKAVGVTMRTNYFN